MAEFKIPINRFDTNLLPPEARQVGTEAFKTAVVLQQIYFRFHHGQTQDARFAGLADAARGLFRLSASRRP